MNDKQTLAILLLKADINFKNDNNEIIIVTSSNDDKTIFKFNLNGELTSIRSN